jgi:hypothetical protein
MRLPERLTMAIDRLAASSISLPIRTVIAILCATLTQGCYDGEVLIKQARSKAVTTRLAEVDLGSFHTTMPRDPNSVSLTELKLHIFGTVPRYRVPEVRQQLKRESYRLRHETLAAVRQATPQELAEPSLARLRKRIESVVNGIIAEAPVKAIGFYEFTMRRM